MPPPHTLGNDLHTHTPVSLKQDQITIGGEAIFFVLFWFLRRSLPPHDDQIISGGGAKDGTIFAACFGRFAEQRDFDHVAFFLFSHINIVGPDLKYVQKYVRIAGLLRVLILGVCTK